MSMVNYFRYPRFAFAPGARHATIYISPDQPADVLTYGVRIVHKNTMLPIVKFTGFEFEESAGALSLQRLGEAVKLMINHAAKACRIPANHSGTLTKITQHAQEGYNIVSIPIFARVEADRQSFITLRLWTSGPAEHSAVATIPQLVFWDIPTMAQFERVCFYAADIARSERP